MTSIVKLEPLSGVHDDGPLCYLLQIDSVFVLLDCGWDESFDLTYMEAVKRRVPHLSAVLISYADPAHLGALPWLYKNAGLTCPVYATVPVSKMGQMFLYDWVQSHMAVEEFAHFTLDDVDAAFAALVQPVKYSQTVRLKGDGGGGISVTPLPAGHMLGGAIWRITKAGEEELLYAVDFNHKRERHINGCTFEGIGRPELMITDAWNAKYVQPKQKARDEMLLTKMLNTVRSGGDVLVVIDTAGRSLEMAHLLDQVWQNTDAGLMTYNLVMLSHVASSVVKLAQSQVEWMSEKILKNFVDAHTNPFQFRHLQLCHNLQELQRVRSPKVVLSSGFDMECGFSRQLFLEWAADSRNTVIITGRSGERTLAARLMRMAIAIEKGEQPSRTVTLEIKRRIRLEGSELEAWRAKKQREQDEAMRKRIDTARAAARGAWRSESTLGGGGGGGGGGPGGGGSSGGDDSDDSDEDEAAIASAVAAVTRQLNKSAPSASDDKGMATTATTTTTATTGAELDKERAKKEEAEQEAQQLLSLATAHDVSLRWELQQQRGAALFFKQHKKSFPLYAYAEERQKWDDYGELIRPEEYMTADSLLLSATAQGADADEKPTDGTETDVKDVQQQQQQQQQQPVWPTKCVSYVAKIEVLCNVEWIDFEGRSDGDSVKKLLAQIKPKQLVVVHGPSDASMALATFCRKFETVQGKVWTPRLGEVVDATIESLIYQVSLADALLSGITLQTIGDTDLAWLDARATKRLRDGNLLAENPEAADQEKKAEDDAAEPMDTTEPGVEKSEASSSSSSPVKAGGLSTAEKWVLEPVPADERAPVHNAVWVNDPRLSELKGRLSAAGVPAEFTGGALVLGATGAARLRRTQAGRFQLDGVASPDYFRIRKLLYAQFAIL